MKETIIYSNSINQTEFLRSLSFNQMNNFGIHVYNANEICDEANIRLAFPVKEKFISYTDEVFIVYEISKALYNFTSFDDIKHVTDTLRAMRSLIVNDNENEVFSNEVTSKYPNDENLNLLKSIFDAYIQYLNDNHLMDKVSYMKKMIAINQPVFDEVVVLEEKLTPIEWALLSSIAKKVTITTLSKFMSLNEKNEPAISSIAPFYGERNEVEGVLYDIFSNKYPLDECVIVLANKEKYTFLLNEYRDRYNIPMTFETGYPITLSNPYKLYRTLNKLENERFFDVNGYKRLFMSEAFTDSYFDTLDYRLRMDAIEVLGRLKISFNAEENEKKIKDFESIDKDNFITFMEKINKSMDIDRIVTLVKKIAEEFSKGKANVLKLCTKIRDGEYNKIDKDGLTAITNYLNDAERYEFNKTFKDSFLKQIDSKYLNPSINKEGHLHITDFKHASSTLRKHIYLVGFSANNFPGKAVEDYLLPNDAINCLTGLEQRASEQKIKDKIEAFDRLLVDYTSLGLDVHLSYSCQNIKDVKDVNPSSAILKLVKDQKAFEDAKLNAGYFKTEVSKLSTLLKTFLDNKKIKTKETSIVQEVEKDDLTKINFSPSALSAFFACPLRFYLDSILYASKQSDYDYFNPLGGPVFGNLLHLVMEMVKKDNIQEEQLSKFIKSVFSDYQKFDVSLNDPDVDYETFYESCMNAYNFIKGYEVVDTEVKVRGEVFGLRFKGEIDAILKKDNKYFILDYKTKKNFEHEDDNVQKDIQAIIYAYLYEQNFGIKADELYFYYTKYDKVFTFHEPFKEKTQNDIKEAITVFKASLEQKFFKREATGPAVSEAEACKYCSYVDICMKGGN